MAQKATIEVSEEVKTRLLDRANGEQRAEVVVADLLDEVEYLERVNELATDGNWPRGEYY